jgi:alkylated DNA repair protein (DNA oxidative demethylase)
LETRRIYRDAVAPLQPARGGFAGFFETDPNGGFTGFWPKVAHMLTGFRHLPGYLDPAAQTDLAAQVAAVLALAPLYRAEMPRTGRPLSVAMSNAGSLGWFSDRAGYRYVERHPITAKPWPPIPAMVLAIWRELELYSHPPEACLINHYEDGARMGLHQDRDEAALDAPVLSISLGDPARFRLGGRDRRDPSRAFWLESGDVVILGGDARLAFHGVDRVQPGVGKLLDRGGRINLTVRRVTVPGC